MDFEEYLNQAVAFYENDELDEALVNFEAALELQPDNAKIRGAISELKELISVKSQREYADQEISYWEKLAR